MFIDDIKNLFSGSDTTVIVFSDEELVWCNRNAEFFGGQFPLYDEFEIKEMKNSENNDTMLFDAEMKNESISLSGELRKSGNFSVFMLSKKDIFKEAFEDSLFKTLKADGKIPVIAISETPDIQVATSEAYQAVRENL